MVNQFKVNKKPRVLHIVTALSWRGGEQQAAYLIQELSDEVEPFVLCSSGSKMEEFCKQNGIDYYDAKLKTSLDFKYAKTIKTLCQKLHIDICHLHDAHAHMFSVIAAAFFKNPTPLILSRRVDFPIKKNWFSKLKYNHKSIAKILCVSDTIKEITAKGIDDISKLATVYSGIDLNKFKNPTGKLRKEFGVQETEFLIGNTSALADHKDYFTFIDTAEKVTEKNKNCRFMIIGDGPMKEEIESYTKSKKLSQPIIFTGFRNDIPEILGELDLFLITSKTEGLGTSILDAFACKVPVVATKGGGIIELVEHEKTGLLCNVKDSNSLANSVLRLKADKELRSKLTEEALIKVQFFSKQETAKQTLKHYLEVLS